MRTWSDVKRDSVAKRRAECVDRRAENRLNLGRAIIMIKFRSICITTETRIVREIAGKRVRFEDGTVGAENAESALPLPD